MRNKVLKSAVTLAFLLPAVALAVGNVGDLATVQSETILLKAKIAKATAENELAEKNKSPKTEEIPLPVVSAVHGSNNALYARFLFNNGSSTEGRVGDILPGGFKVKTINLNIVEVVKGKKVFPLPFSATSQLGDQPNTSSLGIPGIPGMNR